MSESGLLSIDKILVAIVGAVVGGVMTYGGVLGKGILDRNAEKKKPKTEGRAEAYRDFAVFFLHADERGDDRLKKLSEINARLIVYGETEVVEAAAKFLEEIDPRAPFDQRIADKLVSVIIPMRTSLKTGDDRVEIAIKKILERHADFEKEMG